MYGVHPENIDKYKVLGFNFLFSFVFFLLYVVVKDERTSPATNPVAQGIAVSFSYAQIMQVGYNFCGGVIMNPFLVIANNVIVESVIAEEGRMDD